MLVALRLHEVVAKPLTRPPTKAARIAAAPATTAPDAAIRMAAQRAHSDPDKRVRAIGRPSDVDDSGHTYTFTRAADGTTEIDYVVVRGGNNVKGRLLGLVLRTVGKSRLATAFLTSINAMRQAAERNPSCLTHVVVSAPLDAHVASLTSRERAGDTGLANSGLDLR